MAIKFQIADLIKYGSQTIELNFRKSFCASDYTAKVNRAFEKQGAYKEQEKAKPIGNLGIIIEIQP